MSHHNRTGRALFRWALNNATRRATLDAKQLELIEACIDPDERLEITSFTLNGQSGSGTLRGTKEDLLAIIEDALWMLDNGAALSTRTTRVRF